MTDWSGEEQKQEKNLNKNLKEENAPLKKKVESIWEKTNEANQGSGRQKSKSIFPSKIVSKTGTMRKYQSNNMHKNAKAVVMEETSYGAYNMEKVQTCSFNILKGIFMDINLQSSCVCAVIW